MAARQSRMLPLGTRAPDFSLPDTTGRILSLHDFTAPGGLLLAFLGNHCPYVRHILAGFLAFAREYRAKGLDRARGHIRTGPTRCPSDGRFLHRH